MDVIIDTNVIASDYYLRSADFAVLFDYLRSTESRLLLPKVVVEEVGCYRRSLEKALREYKTKSNELRRLGLSVPPPMAPEEACTAYQEFVTELSNRDDVGVIPYRIEYLPEIVRRAVNRIPPCSDSGEEFRDAILWLSVLDHLKTHKGTEVVFITDNWREFGHQEGCGLKQSLQKEAEDTGAVLRHYRLLSDFIATRATTVASITRGWVLERLPEEVVREKVEAFLINNALEALEDYSEKKLQYSDFILSIKGFSGYGSFNLEDFKVYELQDGPFEVHTVFVLELELEIGVEYLTEVGRGRYLSHHRSGESLHYIAPSFRVRLSCSVHDGLMKDLNVVDWEFA